MSQSRMSSGFKHNAKQSHSRRELDSQSTDFIDEVKRLKRNFDDLKTPVLYQRIISQYKANHRNKKLVDFIDDKLNPNEMSLDEKPCNILKDCSNTAPFTMKTRSASQNELALHTDRQNKENTGIPTNKRSQKAEKGVERGCQTEDSLNEFQEKTKNQQRSIRLLEEDVSKLRLENIKLETALKTAQENLAVKGKNQHNTSSSFALPSEFKANWDTLAKDLLITTFADFIDNPYLLLNMVQDFTLICYDLAKKLLIDKSKAILKTLNIPLSSENENALVKHLTSFYQDHASTIFKFTDEEYKLLCTQYQKNCTKIFNHNYQCDISNFPLDDQEDFEGTTQTLFVVRDEYNQYLTSQLESEDFQKFASSYFSMCIYMLLNDPPLKLSVENFKNRKFVFKSFRKNDFNCIDGFAKEGSPSVVILPPVMRNNHIYYGIKPSVLILSEQFLTEKALKKVEEDLNEERLRQQKKLDNSLLETALPEDGGTKVNQTFELSVHNISTFKKASILDTTTRESFTRELKSPQNLDEKYKSRLEDFSTLPTGQESDPRINAETERVDQKIQAEQASMADHGNKVSFENNVMLDLTNGLYVNQPKQESSPQSLSHTERKQSLLSKQEVLTPMSEKRTTTSSRKKQSCLVPLQEDPSAKESPKKLMAECADKNLARTRKAKNYLARNQDSNTSTALYNNYCSTGTTNSSLLSSSLSYSNKEKIRTIKATLMKQKEYKPAFLQKNNDQIIDQISYPLKLKLEETSSRIGSPSSYSSAHPLKNKTNIISSNSHRGGSPISSSRISAGLWNKENVGDTTRIKIKSKEQSNYELSCRSKRASPSPSLEKYNSDAYMKKNQELKEKIKKSLLSTRQDLVKKRENISQEDLISSRHESRASSPNQMRQTVSRGTTCKDVPSELNSTLSNLKKSIEVLKFSKIRNQYAETKQSNNNVQNNTIANTSLVGKIVNQSLRLSAERQDSSEDEKESMNDNSARKQNYASERYGTSFQNSVKRASQRPSDMTLLKPLSQNTSLLKTEATRWKSSSRHRSKQRYGAYVVQGTESSQQELMESFEGSSIQQIRSANESAISGSRIRANQERDLQLPKGVCEDNVKIFDVLKNVYRNSKLLYINDR